MPLGVAVWSIGSHARRNLLPALRAAPSTQIVGVLSRDRAAAQAVAREYDAHAFGSSSEMLEDSRVEAVVLAGPNALHFEQAMATLLAGKHAFVEKSLARSELEVIALAGAAKSRAVVLAECFMFEHHPQFLALRELLRSQELGPLRSLTCRFGFPHLEPTDIRYSQELAGGALNDVGAYCLAAIQRLGGGFPTRVVGELESRDGWEVDTDGRAMLGFHGGVSALADWGFGRSYLNRIEAWCRDGFVTVDRAFSKPPSLETTLQVTHQLDNRIEVRSTGAHNHFVSMFEALVRATRDQKLAGEWRDDALGQARLMDIVRTSGAGLATSGAGPFSRDASHEASGAGERKDVGHGGQQ